MSISSVPRVAASRNKRNAKGAETSFQNFDKASSLASKGVENNVRINRRNLQDVSRERFADLIRTVWPGDSDTDTARQCAAAIGVDERTVRNWLNLTHSAPFDVVFAIGCLPNVGVFKVMEAMTRGQSRTSVLSLIVQGASRVFRN